MGLGSWSTAISGRGSWNCSAVAQGAAIAAIAAARKAHADELRDASAMVTAAEAKLAGVAPAPDMRAADETVAEAKRRVADARAMNPMYRVAAASQRVPVEDLTSEQFETVEHWAVIA